VIISFIFRKTPPSVVSGYDKQSINLNKVVATFEQTCYNNGQKERLCLIIDKCSHQKLCKRAQKISAAAPLHGLMAKMNLKGKKNLFAFGDTTLCRIIVGKFLFMLSLLIMHGII
jgi:hypothetical protein